MSERTEPLRIAVPDIPAARAVASEWSRGVGAAVVAAPLALEVAEAALRAGQVDLAFVPTLAVVRDPDAFSVVPGVGLVGRAYPAAGLHLPAGLAPLAPERTVRIALDPRFAQEAVLAQIVLAEAYHARAQFVPVPPGSAAPPDVDAFLLAPDAPGTASGVTLDLGREWFELTTRPMVWALLATTAGGVEPEEARFLRDRAHELEGAPPEPGVEEPSSFTLAAYAQAGLDAWVHQLFYHRVIDDLAVIPFVVTVENGQSDDDSED